MKQRASDCGTYVLLAAIFTAWDWGDRLPCTRTRCRGQAQSSCLGPSDSPRCIRRAVTLCSGYIATAQDRYKLISATIMHKSANLSHVRNLRHTHKQALVECAASALADRAASPPPPLGLGGGIVGQHGLVHQDSISGKTDAAQRTKRAVSFTSGCSAAEPASSFGMENDGGEQRKLRILVVDDDAGQVSYSQLCFLWNLGFCDALYNSTNLLFNLIHALHNLFESLIRISLPAANACEDSACAGGL